MIKNDTLSIDFETGSYADLRKTGAARYAEDPTTRVLCMAYHLPGGLVRVWREGERFPQDVIEWVRDGNRVAGWNVLFEFYIWNVVLKRQVTNQPIPKLGLGQLSDTMAVAAYNGLPLSLDLAAEALPHLGIKKDKMGHALMLRMSRPRNAGAGTWWHLDDPPRFDALCAYCAQDVRVEMAIAKALVPLPSRERSIWLLDVETSVRGMMLDNDLADAMQDIAQREKTRLDREMSLATGGLVPTCQSVSKLLAWTQSINPRITSLSKDKLASLIDKLNKTPARTKAEECLRFVLLLRQEAAKSSVAKVRAMQNFANSDHRMRGLYQYYGAFRTGRDAGRGPQIQNFPRGSVKDPDRLISYILECGDPEGFEIFFGISAMEGLSSALRGCITVPEGNWFCSYDFSQIEARVTAWLAGETKVLVVFNRGEDIYVAAAAAIYKLPKTSIDADKRQIGKVAVLALGFGGGVGAFQSMAAIYGVEVPDAEAEQIKMDWRDSHRDIVGTWYEMGAAAVRALRLGTPQATADDKIRFHVQKTPWGTKNLHMTLPSGRDLIYRDAELDKDRFGNSCVSAMGVNQYTRKWERVPMWGGLFFQNAVQAIARDVMKAAAIRVSKIPGVRLIGPVHDELLMEMDSRECEEDVAQRMKQRPLWALGLPIDADGYVGKRFRK